MKFPWKHVDIDTGHVFNLDECENCGCTVEAVNGCSISFQDVTHLVRSGVLIPHDRPASTLYYNEVLGVACCERCCQLTDFEEEI